MMDEFVEYLQVKKSFDLFYIRDYFIFNRYQFFFYLLSFCDFFEFIIIILIFFRNYYRCKNIFLKRKKESNFIAGVGSGGYVLRFLWMF